MEEPWPSGVCDVSSRRFVNPILHQQVEPIRHIDGLGIAIFAHSPGGILLNKLLGERNTVDTGHSKRIMLLDAQPSTDAQFGSLKAYNSTLSVSMKPIDIHIESSDSPLC